MATDMSTGRSRRCPPCGVQPALKHAVRKGAAVAALAGALCTRHQASEEYVDHLCCGGAAYLLTNCPHEVGCAHRSHFMHRFPAEDSWASNPAWSPASYVTCAQVVSAPQASHLPEVWACRGYIFVDGCVPPACLLSNVGKRAHGPVMAVDVTALGNLHIEGTVYT